ncbi:MAG: hypothetical protein HY782_04665 [Chloroflexi bacterium]|nr:hypothetical protein [Chloroflexota bacterium]
MASLATVLLMLFVALSGSGITAFAAQGALPDNPLYTLKLLSEDAQLGMAENSEMRANLSLDFAGRRMGEIAALAAKGAAAPEAVAARQQAQIEFALQSAARMDDVAMNRELGRAQQALNVQMQVADMARAQAGQQLGPALDRVREMLGMQLMLIELGLQNPPQFRERMQGAMQGQPQGQQTPMASPTMKQSQAPMAQPTMMRPQTPMPPATMKQQQTPMASPTMKQQQTPMPPATMMQQPPSSGGMQQTPMPQPTMVQQQTPMSQPTTMQQPPSGGGNQQPPSGGSMQQPPSGGGSQQPPSGGGMQQTPSGGGMRR